LVEELNSVGLTGRPLKLQQDGDYKIPVEDFKRITRQRKLAQIYITDFICAAVPPLRRAMHAFIVTKLWHERSHAYRLLCRERFLQKGGPGRGQQDHCGGYQEGHEAEEAARELRHTVYLSSPGQQMVVQLHQVG